MNTTDLNATDPALQAHEAPTNPSRSAPTAATPKPPDPAVSVRQLRKSYDTTLAVDDVSFQVAPGEIFGILGPNGAGKTTTVEMITGLRRPDAGQVSVLGMDPWADRAAFTQAVGVQLQSSHLPEKIRVGEAVALYQSFYRDPLDAGELLERLGLSGSINTRYAALSGGQQQRLAVALALVGRPRVAVLDELTTGLDPQARRETWDLISGIRERGSTVLLVTHFMEEAEYLAGRVAVIVQGRVVAEGTPEQLAQRATVATRVTFAPSTPFPDTLLSELDQVTTVSRAGDTVTVTGNDDVVQAVATALSRSGITANSLRVHQGSLDDAFLAITGTPPERPARTDHEPGRAATSGEPT